jgi:hypothetical protein
MKIILWFYSPDRAFLDIIHYYDLLKEELDLEIALNIRSVCF